MVTLSCARAHSLYRARALSLSLSLSLSLPLSPSPGTSRAEYRKQRLNQYRNYENLDEAQRSEVSASSLQHDVSQHNGIHCHLLQICRALMQICRALLRICRALLQICRALLYMQHSFMFRLIPATPRFAAQ